MTDGLTIDASQFQAALKEYYPTTKKSLSEILNQRAYNIAGRAADALQPTPGSEIAKRREIKRYMDEPIAIKIRRVKSTGKFKQRGRAKDQLTRKNLIIQARRAKKGLKGLYGVEMREQSGRFSQAAQVSVGFLKSAFLPIIKGLYTLVKFRAGIKTRWSNISVWPGSDGYGKVTPAKGSSWNPFVEMFLRWKVSGSPSKVDRITRRALQDAFNAEARELMRHVQEKLQGEANRINAR